MDGTRSHTTRTWLRVSLGIALVAVTGPTALASDPAAELQARVQCTEVGGPYAWQGGRVRTTDGDCAYLADADLLAVAIGPDGVVSVLDGTRGVIDHFASNGTPIDSIAALGQTRQVQLGGGTPIDVPAVDGVAVAMALDGHGGVYVSTCCPVNTIEHLDSKGNLIQTFGLTELTHPAAAITVADDGRLFVVTRGNGGTSQVLVFNADGTRR